MAHNFTMTNIEKNIILRGAEKRLPWELIGYLIGKKADAVRKF